MFQLPKGIGSAQWNCRRYTRPKCLGEEGRKKFGKITRAIQFAERPKVGSLWWGKLIVVLLHQYVNDIDCIRIINRKFVSWNWNWLSYRRKMNWIDLPQRSVPNKKNWTIWIRRWLIWRLNWLKRMMQRRFENRFGCWRNRMTRMKLNSNHQKAKWFVFASSFFVILLLLLFNDQSNDLIFMYSIGRTQNFSGQLFRWIGFGWCISVWTCCIDHSWAGWSIDPKRWLCSIRWWFFIKRTYVPLFQLSDNFMRTRQQTKPKIPLISWSKTFEKKIRNHSEKLQFLNKFCQNQLNTLSFYSLKFELNGKLRLLRYEISIYSTVLLTLASFRSFAGWKFIA